MTEADWNSSTDPHGMLTFLWHHGNLSARKARLFAVACCRQAWHLFRDEHTRRAVVVAEWDVDGLTNKEVVRVAARGVAGGERVGRLRPLDVAPLRAAWVALTMGRDSPGASGATAPPLLDAISSAADLLAFVTSARDKERRNQAALLRDIFGPILFREVRIDPAWLAWNGGSVVKLAEAAYEHREMPSGTLDNARLGVLADALEDTGCSNADLLGHLHGPGLHVRGCFALDAILGKN